MFNCECGKEFIREKRVNISGERNSHLIYICLNGHEKHCTIYEGHSGSLLKYDIEPSGFWSGGDREIRKQTFSSNMTAKPQNTQPTTTYKPSISLEYTNNTETKEIMSQKEIDKLINTIKG